MTAMAYISVLSLTALSLGNSGIKNQMANGVGLGLAATAKVATS